jgi:hypothetical protein
MTKEDQAKNAIAEGFVATVDAFKKEAQQMPEPALSPYQVSYRKHVRPAGILMKDIVSKALRGAKGMGKEMVRPSGSSTSALGSAALSGATGALAAPWGEKAKAGTIGAILGGAAGARNPFLGAYVAPVAAAGLGLERRIAKRKRKEKARDKRLSTIRRQIKQYGPA